MQKGIKPKKILNRQITPIIAINKFREEGRTWWRFDAAVELWIER